MRPLNGIKTHPLTSHARQELDRICLRPVPRQSVNPGVADRLLRGELVTVVHLPSPYAIHKGKNIDHLQITPAGMVELASAN